MTPEQAASELDAAEAALAALSSPLPDSAACRLKPSALKQAEKRLDSHLRQVVAAIARVDKARTALARALSESRNASRPVASLEAIQRATAVRDRHGWHKVIRVNRKTVTVESGYSWTETIPLDRIEDAR